MIKIIKPGKYNVVTCPVCKCEFSYEDEDIQYGEPVGHGVGHGDRFHLPSSKEVKCPCCNNHVDLYRIR